MKLTVPEILPSIKHYYSKPGNSIGGSLHLVLEDGNVKNNDILFCLNWAKEHQDVDGIIIAEQLLQMTKTQRLKLSYLVHL